jgi:hypothetical protein
MFLRTLQSAGGVLYPAWKGNACRISRAPQRGRMTAPDRLELSYVAATLPSDKAKAVQRLVETHFMLTDKDCLIIISNAIESALLGVCPKQEIKDNIQKLIDKQLVWRK